MREKVKKNLRSVFGSGDAGVTALGERSKSTERNYFALLDSLSDAAYILGGNGRFLYVNEKFVSIFGYTKGELLAKEFDPMTLISEESVEFINQRRDNPKSKVGDHDIYTFYGKAKGGKKLHIEANVNQIVFEDERCVQGILKDVTKELELKRAVENRDRYLRSLIENPLVAIITIDEEGFILLFNQGAEILTDYKAEEIVGDSIIKLYHNRRIINKVVITAFLKGISQNYEMEFVKKDSEVVYVKLFVTPLRNEKNTIIGALCIGIDISEEKRYAEKILKRNKELDILNQVSSSITKTIDFNEVVNEVLENIHSLMEADFVSLYLTDQDKLVYKASRNMPDGQAKVFKIEETVLSIKAIQSRKTEIGYNFRSYAVDDDTDPKDLPEVVIATPLILSDGNILGLIYIGFENDRQITDEEVNLLSTITSQVGIAIENARLYDRVNRWADDLTSLLEISNLLSSTLDYKDSLLIIIEKSKQLLKADISTIYLLSRKDNILRPVATNEGSYYYQIMSFSIKLGEGIIGDIAQKGKPEVVNNAQNDDRSVFVPGTGTEQEHMLVVPLTAKGKTMGVMCLERFSENQFTNEDLNVMSLFSKDAVAALENAVLYNRQKEHIRQLQTIEELVKALNSTLDPQSLFGIISSQIKKIIPCIRISIGIYHENEKEFSLAVVSNDKGTFLDTEIRVPRDETTMYKAIQSKGHFICNDLSRMNKRIRDRLERFGIRSYINFPIEIDGRVTTCLNLFSDRVNYFTEDKLKLLYGLTNHIALSIRNSRLYRELETTYVNLKSTQNQLVTSERLRALGEMTSGVAHDFNNVLGAIMGRAQLLKLKAKDEEVIQGLEIIEKAATDGSNTVKRMQDFTRVRTDTDFVTLNLYTAIQDVVEITQTRWKDDADLKGIKIDLKLDLKKDIFIKGNLSEIREVFTNIMFNGIDAMSTGGTLTIRTSQKGNKAEVVFSDTGKGMSKEVQARVFEPFFTTKGVKGNGLGMSVVYGIVSRHFGEIEIDSEEDKGTNIIIRLPKSDKQSDEGKKKKKVTQPKSKKKARVLVIDDEENIRTLLSEILEFHDHSVTLCENGLSGIEELKKGDYDIVFTDLGMPDMSGWEVARAVREIKPKTAIALITGWAVQLDKKKMAEAGINHIISKPFEIEAIIDAVDKIMNS